VGGQVEEIEKKIVKNAPRRFTFTRAVRTKSDRRKKIGNYSEIGNVARKDCDTANDRNKCGTICRLRRAQTRVLFDNVRRSGSGSDGGSGAHSKLRRTNVDNSVTFGRRIVRKTNVTAISNFTGRNVDGRSSLVKKRDGPTTRNFRKNKRANNSTGCS